MPHIEQKWRAKLNPYLLGLCAELRATARMQARAKLQEVAGGEYIGEPSETEVTAATVGIFNYVITALAVTLTGEPSYFRCAAVRIAMLDAAQEYYRKMVAPYEDRKAAENGDVYPS